MKKDFKISLHLQNLEQMLVPKNSPFYGKRLLNQEAEDLIIEEIQLNHRPGSFTFKIYLLSDDAQRTGELTEAIHQHFSYRKKKSEAQVKQILLMGWRSFFVALVFLAILVPLALVVKNLLPEGGFSTTFREILIVLGWVALWRPAEYLLYEWRSFKREALLFRMLEKSKVDIVSIK